VAVPAGSCPRSHLPHLWGPGNVKLIRKRCPGWNGECRFPEVVFSFGHWPLTHPAAPPRFRAEPNKFRQPHAAQLQAQSTSLSTAVENRVDTCNSSSRLNSIVDKTAISFPHNLAHHGRPRPRGTTSSHRLYCSQHTNTTPKARLQSHAQAFEGLLSLIPAKLYYDKDNSEQYLKKKQTPEERRTAKKAKLNPASIKSAKDVLDENERKRRREDEDGEEVSDLDAPGKEKPLQGLKAPKHKVQKQKVKDDVHSQDGETPDTRIEQPQLTASERKREKELRKKVKQARKDEKRKTKQAQKARKEATTRPAKSPADTLVVPLESEETHHIAQNDDDEEEEVIVLSNDMEAVDVTGLVPDIEQDAESAASESPAPGSTFSHTSPQPASSNSSVVPLPSEEIFTKPGKNVSTASAISTTAAPPTSSIDSGASNKPSKLPNIDHEALKARLYAKIEAMRTARNADGLNGKPAKNRAELIEARRLKQEKRKQHKKELRQEAKDAEKAAEMEAKLAEMRGSPSIASDIFGPARSRLGTLSPPNNFSFGRVAFKDGQRVNSTLSGVVDGGKKKPAMDTRQALLQAEKKKARLMSFDDEKRADIEEKDVWLNAKKKVNGERVRDDTNLLKKTLKRKEKIKLKSETEWNERIEGVKKGQDFKIKKREANLAKRKDEKGGKGKGTKKGAPKKKKNRPGFEGSFKGRA
jgi:hypothetical protein